jgi:sRNA-binding carbon storage regulator CsrA
MTIIKSIKAVKIIKKQKAAMKGSNIKGVKYGTSIGDGDDGDIDSRGSDRGSLGMTLRVGDSVVIGNDISVVVTKIKSGPDGGLASVGIAVIAPRSVDISRIGQRQRDNVRAWSKATK